MFGREPAVIIGLIAAAIALGVGFGLPVSSAQVGLIMAFVAAALGVLTRTQVTPNKTSDQLIEVAVSMPAGTDVEEVKEELASQNAAR